MFLSICTCICVCVPAGGEKEKRVTTDGNITHIKKGYCYDGWHGKKFSGEICTSHCTMAKAFKREHNWTDERIIIIFCVYYGQGRKEIDFKLLIYLEICV